MNGSDKPANAYNNVITENSKTVNPTKSVDKVVSTENNFSKQTEHGIVTTVSKDIKKVDNSTLIIGTTNGTTTNTATPSIADLTPSKMVDAAEIQNNILDKTNLLLLPLATKPLLPIETLEKEHESIRIAGTIKPIKVRKQYNIFSKMSMPEVNIGIVGSVGRLGKYETEGFGIGTDIGLSRNWSIVASAEKHDAHFEMKDKNKRFHLPNEPPGVPRDRQLMELEGVFKDFRLSLGAKYVFLTHKKFRPYVLAQHVWKKAPPSFVAFKYEKPNGDKEDFLERLESKSFANIWQVGTGMTGDFNNRLSWNAGLNYMFDFNATNHNTNPLTLRAGVYYRL